MKNPIRFDQYVHSEKSSNYVLGKELGLSEAALKEFVYCAYEVRLIMEVDPETGFSRIIEVDGVPLNFLAK